MRLVVGVRTDFGLFCRLDPRGSGLLTLLTPCCQAAPRIVQKAQVQAFRIKCSDCIEPVPAFGRLDYLRVTRVGAAEQFEIWVHALLEPLDATLTAPLMAKLIRDFFRHASEVQQAQRRFEDMDVADWCSKFNEQARLLGC